MSCSVNVFITGDLLTVRGERRIPEHETGTDGYHRVERAYGKFERTVKVRSRRKKSRSTFRG